MLTSTGALLADSLLNIPLVMPVPVAIGPQGARLLPAGPDEADYTVHALDAEPLALPPGTAGATSALAAANAALDDIEAAARASEYHDFDWWQERVARIRIGLAAHRT
jgi:hypothetical protein